MKLRNQQTPFKKRGMTSVEFALVGLAALLIIFMAMEMGRMMFTLNALAESTRRGARVAAVCTLDNAEISRIAVFNSSGSGAQSPILPQLTTDNVVVEYLDEDGAVLEDVALDVAAGDNSTYLQIRYVRVRIENYQHSMILPGMNVSFMAPEFPTTIPRESLGVPRPDQTSTCV
jgi:hypothetical protein